jgi:hypothetical protein
MLAKYVDKLTEIAQNADELPEEVEGAINEVLAHVDDPVPWYKALVFKNGKFSKTAMFATIANFLVLGAYVLSFFQGTVLGRWTVPAFDAEAAGMLLVIVNGTYVANRLASNRENGNG